MSKPTEAYMLVLIEEYEEKLIEIMGKEKYLSFAKEVGKKAIRAEFEAMEDSDFKRFCLEHFDEIAGEY